MKVVVCLVEEPFNDDDSAGRRHLKFHNDILGVIDHIYIDFRGRRKHIPETSQRITIPGPIIDHRLPCDIYMTLSVSSQRYCDVRLKYLCSSLPTKRLCNSLIHEELLVKRASGEPVCPE